MTVMAEELGQSPRGAGSASMPSAIKLGLAIALSLIAAGGFFLFSVRGEALLIDLYATTRMLLCF